MPKSPSNKARKSKPSFEEVKSSKVYALARNLARDPDSPKYDVWEEQLGALTRKYLMAGRDDVIDLAMQKAADALDEVAWEELRFQAEHEAQTVITLGLQNSDPVVKRLFTVPVIFRDAPDLADGLIPDENHFGQLAKSFRASGLITDSQSVVLTNYLYHPAELDALPWSKIMRLSGRIVSSCFSRAPGVAPSMLGQIGWPAPPEAQGNPPISLRYLVGVICDSGESSSPFHYELETADLWFKKMEEWQKAAATILKEALGGRVTHANILVSAAGPFYSALSAGAIDLKVLDVRLQAAAILKETGIAPRSVDAVVALYVNPADESQVIASLSSRLDGSLLGVVKCAIDGYETDREILELTADELERAGLASVNILEEEVPLVACEGCGAPLYLAPTGAEGELMLGHVGSVPESGTLH